MEDPVEDYILEKKLDNDRNLWEDECWGNLPPLLFKVAAQLNLFVTLVYLFLR